MNTRIYHEHGFYTREEYLVWLSKEYQAPLGLVTTLADSLGRAGEFVELPNMLADYQEELSRYDAMEGYYVCTE